MTLVQIATARAFSLLDTPYIWGGDLSARTFFGLDCSGLIQLIFEPLGLDPKGDQKAQAFYNYYKNKECKTIQEGCVLFFGKSKDKITHVAYAISTTRMIEAAGGNSKCTSVEIANKLNAKVKVSPIKKRKDLVSVINLFF